LEDRRDFLIDAAIFKEVFFPRLRVDHPRYGFA
jgi:hypothetical protein